MLKIILYIFFRKSSDQTKSDQKFYLLDQNGFGRRRTFDHISFYRRQCSSRIYQKSLQHLERPTFSHHGHHGILFHPTSSRVLHSQPMDFLGGIWSKFCLFDRLVLFRRCATKFSWKSHLSGRFYSW